MTCSAWSTAAWTDIEELDLVVRNESTDPFWSHEGPYILVECKNWVAPVGRPEIDVFRGKMHRRRQRCRLGIFVALGGFTEPLLTVANSVASESPDLILPVDLARLEAWIGSDDRVEFLKALHTEVTTAG